MFRYNRARDPQIELERMVNLGLKGVKLQPTVQQFYPDDSKLFKIYEKMCELHLPVLFHAGKERAPIEYVYATPRRFKQVLASFPQLTVILAHLGGYQMWDEISVLTEFHNIYFDTSCTVGEVSPKKLHALIEQLTADRIVFGSDFPWFNYDTTISGIMQLGLTEKQKEKIFSANALALLRLEKI